MCIENIAIYLKSYDIILIFILLSNNILKLFLYYLT